AGRPERAEPALARSHAQPGPAPDVVEAARPVLLEERVERVSGDHLALADEVRVAAAGRLVLGEAVAQPVRPAVALLGQDLLGGRARGVQPQLADDDVGRLLR